MTTSYYHLVSCYETASLNDSQFTLGIENFPVKHLYYLFGAPRSLNMHFVVKPFSSIGDV